MTDSRKKAKSFNKHFASTDTMDSNPRIDAGMKRNLKHKERCYPPNNHSGFTQTLRTTGLKAALKKLKPHKAPGSDQITNEIMINCIGKLVERMINERLKTLLEHNNIIPPCQADFRSNYTTKDQLIILTQDNPHGFQMNKTRSPYLLIWKRPMTKSGGKVS